jgi:hypothetical protein
MHISGLNTFVARAAVACLLVATVTFDAGAATLQLSKFFQLPIASGSGNPTQSTVFDVPQFDPTLGTLDSIEFELVRGVLNFSWTVDNESAFSSVLTDASATLSTTLAWFGGELAGAVQQVNFGPPFAAVAADTDGDANFTGADSFTFFGAFPLLAQTVTLNDPIVLAAFIGNGAVLLEESAKFLPGSPGPGIFFHAATLAQSTGGVVWKYHYTPLADPPLPPSIPEPAMMALFLVGIATALARRRVTR